MRVRASTWTDETVFVGSAEGVADGSATVNVDLGNAVFAKARLEGADGFRYDVNCDGAVGGPVDGSDGDPAYGDGAYFLTVAHRYAFAGDCGAMPFDENERELTVGPVNQAGIEITRKVYVPPAGGFARFLAILTNTTDRPVTVPVEIDGGLASAGPDSPDRRPVFDGAHLRRHGLGRPAAAIRPSASSWREPGPPSGPTRSTASATAATGSLQVDGDAFSRPDRGADALRGAEALRGRRGGSAAGGSPRRAHRPGALEQMTPEERSHVVNFDVP